jgi:heptosyltransferase-1
LSAKTKKPFSILVIRLSAIGDIVFASPLIKALRGRYPEARIVWLAQSGIQPLLELHADLDEVIVWPRSQWHRLLRQRQWLELLHELRRFRRLLRSYRFDLALDIQGLLKSGLFAWTSGAIKRIGLGSREGSQWLMTQVIGRGGESKRIGSEYLYLAQQLGLPADPFEMHIEISGTDEQYAKDLIVNQQLHRGYLVICPFTTRPQKHWFAERWLDLVARLHRSFGLPVVMLGGPDDQQQAFRMAAKLTGDLLNQVGMTSLRQAAALIKHAQLTIGVDTGLTHMGIAFNRPTIALFGSTCPYLDTTHDNAIVLYHKLDCSPCKRNPTCNDRFDCMAAITVDEVLDQARRLLHATGEMQ